jgi:hypothetical protein
LGEVVQVDHQVVGKQKGFLEPRWEWGPQAAWSEVVCLPAWWLAAVRQLPYPSELETVRQWPLVEVAEWLWRQLRVL